MLDHLLCCCCSLSLTGHGDLHGREAALTWAVLKFCSFTGHGSNDRQAKAVPEFEGSCAESVGHQGLETSAPCSMGLPTPRACLGLRCCVPA